MPWLCIDQVSDSRGARIRDGWCPYMMVFGVMGSAEARFLSNGLGFGYFCPVFSKLDASQSSKRPFLMNYQGI